MAETKTYEFFNRELGWLKFNQRVLFQAQDPRLPLLERIRFLNIYNSNLDEFFMKRVGGLKRQHLSKVSTLSQDGLTAEAQLEQIRSHLLALNPVVDELIHVELGQGLKEQGIQLLEWQELSKSEQDWADEFFRAKIFPVLTPMAVDLGHPFPLISNLSTSLAVALKIPREEDLLFARIKIPQVFAAWIRIPQTVAPGDNKAEHRFVSTLTLVRQNLQDLFPFMEIQAVMPFRVTRNVDIEADVEDAEDLLELIEEEVKQRRWAEVVRLEVGPQPDPWLLNFLLEELELEPEDVYEYPFFLESKDLGAIAELDIPALKFKAWPSVSHPALLDEETSIFTAIKNHDLLVHHPYESFRTSVERFISTAAKDPQVVAIKMTLYRTLENSPIVQSLIQAAERGKQVVCLIELQARFDEERNIVLAQALERAGVHVVYGLVGLKTHAKLTLIVRQEKEEFRSYVHIGTGNYHPHTAKLYTDMSYFTCRPEITSEVIEIFHYLTGRSLKSDYQHLLVAPLNLKECLLSLIQKETELAKKNRPSGIIVKCNNLQDQDLIEALYEASAAGVPIQMIVRGFCTLVPQKKGLSENISVISILGPLLEHTRAFYFRQGHKDPLDGHFLIGSADWMRRNLKRRVEVLCPLMERGLKEKLWESLQMQLKDQRLAWDMNSEGGYKLRKAGPKDPELGSQQALMEKAQARALSLIEAAMAGQKVSPPTGQ